MNKKALSKLSLLCTLAALCFHAQVLAGTSLQNKGKNGQNLSSTAKTLQDKTASAYKNWSIELLTTVKNIKFLSGNRKTELLNLWASQKHSLKASLANEFKTCLNDNENPGKTTLDRAKFCAIPLFNLRKSINRNPGYSAFYVSASSEIIRETLDEHGVERGIN